MALPKQEINNARVKPDLKKREARRQAIAEIMRRWFPDTECLKKNTKPNQGGSHARTA